MAATPRRATESSHFRVVVRARPLLPHEHDEGADGMEISGNAITLRSHDSVTNAQVFQFDRVFDASSAQDEVYQGAAQPAVASVVEGFNASIIAYGQTGTGKTYTMEGTTEAPGIIPRAIGDIFAHVERGQLEAPTRKRFLLRTAYLQIYNDNVSDLLRPERTGLLIREDRKYATQCSNPRLADVTDTSATHTLEPCLGQARPVRGEPLRVGGAPPVGSAAAAAPRLGGARHGSDARERGELTQPRRLHHSARAK